MSVSAPSRRLKSRLIAALCVVVLGLIGLGYRSTRESPPNWPWEQSRVDDHDDGTLTVVNERPAVPGYDRSCEAGHGCVFGPAWTDDVNAPDGGNGCDQRSDTMRKSLEQVQLKPGTNGCIVASGVLHDPYTGQTVTYQRTGNTEVVADHVIPLAAAWDLGAAQWTLQKRQNFANDPRNLIITTRGANLAKGDKTPGEWMPQLSQCRYAQTYLEVARLYGVAITRADQRALTTATQSC